MDKETIDYDLKACIDNNPQDGYTLDDIAEVLAVWEGENDGDAWRWILRLNDTRLVYLNGWCDYTGWDCRSGAFSSFAETPSGVLLYEETDEVRKSLLDQIVNGKSATWREAKDAELGVDSINDVIN